MTSCSGATVGIFPPTRAPVSTLQGVYSMITLWTSASLPVASSLTGYSATFMWKKKKKRKQGNAGVQIQSRGRRRSNVVSFCLPGLKTGGSSSSGAPGGTTHHYTFHGDPHATFATFFGGSNPFDMFFGSNRGHGRSNGFSFHTDHDTDLDMDEDDPFAHFGRHFGFPGVVNNGEGRRRRGGPSERLGTVPKHQDPPVVHELKVSLEEIFHGCTKRIKITRRRLNPDGRSMRTEDKILNIVIKKGWKEGTKITFPKEGDETPENIPADIAFVLKDKGHPHFKRDGSNIIYKCKITLKEVRRACFFFFFL